jgi:GLPGLI family protein
MKCLSKILVLFCVIICCSIQEIYTQPSQYNLNRNLSDKAIDSAYLQIKYSLLYISDSLQPNKVLNDRKILLIGDSIQHFYSEYQRSKDSVATAARKKGKAFKPLSFFGNIMPEGYDVYTYHIQERRMVQEHITELSSYRYQESIEKLYWQLSVDTCTILSYLCQKATTCFRGRDWTVWFTMEIPINAGPWKLCGLPGLIMKASDSRGHYVFECIGLENISKKKQPIINTSINDPVIEIECTRQEYMTAQRQYYENYFYALLAMGWCLHIYDDSGKKIDFIKTPNTTLSDKGIMWGKAFVASEKYKKYPYNPIELE